MSPIGKSSLICLSTPRGRLSLLRQCNYSGVRDSNSSRKGEEESKRERWGSGDKILRQDKSRHMPVWCSWACTYLPLPPQLPTTPSTTLWSDVRRACSQPPDDEEEDAANSSRVVISALPTVQAAAPASLPLIVPRIPEKKSINLSSPWVPAFSPSAVLRSANCQHSVMGPRGFFRHHVPHPSATLAAKKSLAAGAARRVLRVKVAEVGGLGRLLDFSPRDEDLRQVSLVFIYFRRGGGDEDGKKGEKEKLGEITEQSRQTTVTELNGVVSAIFLFRPTHSETAGPRPRGVNSHWFNTCVVQQRSSSKSTQSNKARDSIENWERCEITKEKRWAQKVDSKKRVVSTISLRKDRKVTARPLHLSTTAPYTGVFLVAPPVIRQQREVRQNCFVDTLPV